MIKPVKENCRKPSDLVPNADGSIDIYIQSTTPAGHESNWLPAPAGDFKLMLRAYLPGHAVLDGEYHVPPVIKVQWYEYI